jgi:hypothetical protein
MVRRALARRTERAKDVAGSPDRVQQSRLGFGLELAAQIGDENLDRVRRGEGVIAPHLVEQALARDHDALVAHQILEQLELTLGELDRALATDDLVGIDVQREIAYPQRRRPPGRAAAQQGTDAREQLLALERLDQIIVRARIEPLHPGLHGVARGQDQDRYVVFAAQRACDLEAVEPGQAEIEDHEVRRERPPLLERRPPVAGRADLVSLHAE